MISDDSLMLTAIFKIGVRIHYIAEAMFNNNNPPRTCATLFSLSLFLCSLPRFANAYCTLSVQRTLMSAIRYAFSIVFYAVIYKLFVRDRWIFARRVIHIHPFLKSQTNERRRWEGRGGGIKLFIRGNISPDLFMQQTNAFALQRKRGTSNVCDAVWDVLKTIRMLHVFFELLIQLIPSQM